MQLDLFSAPSQVTPHRALARRDGPDSSKLAAQQIVDQLPASYAKILQAAQEFGKPFTARELSGSKFYDGDNASLNKRLGEMVKRGLLVRGALRICGETLRLATEWRLK